MREIRALIIGTPADSLGAGVRPILPLGPGIEGILRTIVRERIDVVVGPGTVAGRPLREIVRAAAWSPPVLDHADALRDGPCPGFAQRLRDYGLVGRRLRRPAARDLPRRDPHTGLVPAERFIARLRAGLAPASPTACVMLDGGPHALLHLARSIQARGLPGFRWDEHRAAVLLADTSPERALALAEAWRAELDGTSPDGGRTFPAFTLGVAHATHGPSLDLVRRAALALDHAEPLLWWDALAARHLAACTHGRGTLEARTDDFLARLDPRLGPSQRAHLGTHAREVERTAEALARLMRLDPHAVEPIRLAARLHDLGKATIPESILARPGPLSPVERRLIDRHADEGATLARLLGAPATVCEIVRHHHARYDGGPAPLGALVVAVADALATMTSERAYSRARSLSEALAELRRGRGTQFHPQAVVAAHLLAPNLMRAAA